MSQKKEATRKVVERSPSHVKYLVGGVVLVLIALGIAYALGVSDSGQINVDGVIIEDREENPDREVVNTNTRATVPNGGLVGKGDVGEENTPPQPSPTETGTSTDDTASSTDETATSTDEASGGESEETADESTQEDLSLEELSADLANEEESTEGNVESP